MAQFVALHLQCAHDLGFRPTDWVSAAARNRKHQVSIAVLGYTATATIMTVACHSNRTALASSTGSDDNGDVNTEIVRRDPSQGLSTRYNRPISQFPAGSSDSIPLFFVF